MKHPAIKILAVAAFLVAAESVRACPWCRASVKSGVYDEDFIGNLFVLLLPILILTTIGIAVYFKDEITKTFKRKIQK